MWVVLVVEFCLRLGIPVVVFGVGVPVEAGVGLLEQLVQIVEGKSMAALRVGLQEGLAVVLLVARMVLSVLNA